MSNNTTAENNNNSEYDQVDFESIDASDASDDIEPAPNDFIDGQNNETNEILAEMCFLEAEDLFSRGDRSGAISSYHQAHRYAPTKVNYCLKLIDLLSEEASTLKEAEQILNKALALFPNNLELNIRLNKLKNKTVKLNTQVNREIQGFLEQSEISTQKVFRDEIRAVAAAMGVDLDKEAKQAGITQDTAAMLREIDELETKSGATGSLSTKKVGRENKSATTKLQSPKTEETPKAIKLSSDNPEDILREIDELEAKSGATGSLSTKKAGRENKSATTKLQSPKTEETPKVIKPASDDPEDMLREIDELETQASTLTGSFRAANTRKLSDITVETSKTGNLDRSKNPNKTKTSKLKSVDSGEVIRPNQISSAKWLVLSLIFLIALAGLGYEVFSKPLIVLIGPVKENISDAKEIKFEWKSDKENMQYVLEVYEGETFIIKQFTKETSYTPTAQELEKFSPNHIYKWRVLIPVGLAGSYNFATNLKTFSVSKVFEATSSPKLLPENQQPNPDTLLLEPKPIEPKPEETPKFEHVTPTQKSNYEGDI